MILLIATCFSIQILTAQSETYSYNDAAMLTSLYSEIQASPSRSVCYPWASTMRLVNIKENQKAMTELLSYEKLWVALHDTCLKNQRVSTQLEVTLDKRGRITSIKRNGEMIDLSEQENLRRKKFSKHKSKEGKVISIFTRIG